MTDEEIKIKIDLSDETDYMTIINSLQKTDLIAEELIKEGVIPGFDSRMNDERNPLRDKIQDMVNAGKTELEITLNELIILSLCLKIQYIFYQLKLTYQERTLSKFGALLEKYMEQYKEN